VLRRLRRTYMKRGAGEIEFSDPWSTRPPAGGRD